MKTTYLMAAFTVAMIIGQVIFNASSQYESSRLIGNGLIALLLMKIMIELASIGEQFELFLKWYNEKK